jgi:transposase
MHALKVHGATASGEVVLQKKLRRHELLGFLSSLRRCTVAMEACAGSHC